MIFKGIAATTQLDAHNTKITKEALENLAQNITHGDYAVSMGIEHDITVMPVGKTYKAFVDRLDQEDHALYIEQELFDNTYAIDVGGEQYVMTKSEFDTRPFSSGELADAGKLVIQTDPVNFESYEKSEEFFSKLSKEFDIETGHFMRKSVIPDPEIIFELARSSVTYLIIYLSSKKVIERIGDSLTEKALEELNSLYEIIKKTVIYGAKYFVPKNRPVTYVFRGSVDYVIELVVRTTSPDVAISAVTKDGLNSVTEKLDTIKENFSTIRKVQFLFNEEESRWEFNYLTTEKGEVIGTEKSHERTAKLIELHFGDSSSKSTSCESSE